MTRSSLPENVLAIETGIRGGSLSVVRSGSEIAGLSGNSNFSRAEDLLINIHSLIQSAGMLKSDIHAVAVSRGPGSYTGIRIGLATAAGLSRSLKIPYIGVPLLDAIALTYCQQYDAVVVVPFGRSEFVIQRFSSKSDKPLRTRAIQVVDYGGLEEFLTRNKLDTIICHSDSIKVLQKLLETLPSTPKLVNAGSNLAFAVYCWSAAYPNSVDQSPIYAANPNHSNNLF